MLLDRKRVLDMGNVTMKAFFLSSTTSMLLLRTTNSFYCHPCQQHQSLSSSSSSRLFCTRSNSITGKGIDISSYLLITSPTNDKVKLLKSLHIKKKRDEENKVLLEGHRQVIDAIRGGTLPNLLLFSDESVSSPLGDQLLEALKLCNQSSIYRSTENIIQSVSDTVHGQGVVGAFPKPNYMSSLLPVPHTTKPLIVLLDRPADPGNCGTIIRTSYGFGVDAIIIVEGCDPWSPKVLRSAMGTCLKLPVFETNWSNVETLLKDSYGSNVQILLADADPSAAIYHTVDMTRPTVLIIGSEATGIGPESQLLPQAMKIRIPTATNRDLESFNAAVACSVLLGEVGRQRGKVV